MGFSRMSFVFCAFLIAVMVSQPSGVFAAPNQSTEVQLQEGNTSNSSSIDDEDTFQERIPFRQVPARRSYELKADQVAALLRQVEQSGALGTMTQHAIAESAEHPVDYFAIDAAVEYFATRLEKSIKFFGTLKKRAIDRSRGRSIRGEKLSGSEKEQLQKSMTDTYMSAIFSLMNSTGRNIQHRHYKIINYQNGSRTSFRVEFLRSNKDRWATLHNEMIQLLSNCASEYCHHAIAQAFRDLHRQVASISVPLDYNKMGDGDASLLFNFSNVILEAAFRRAYEAYSGTRDLSTSSIERRKIFARGIFLPLSYEGYTSSQGIASSVVNFTPIDMQIALEGTYCYKCYDAAINDADRLVNLKRMQGIGSMNGRFALYELRKAELLGLEDLPLISRAMYFPGQTPTVGTCVLQINDMPLTASVELGNIQEALDRETNLSYVLRNAVDRNQATAVRDREGNWVRGTDLLEDAMYVATQIRELLYEDLCGEL